MKIYDNGFSQLIIAGVMFGTFGCAQKQKEQSPSDLAYLAKREQIEFQKHFPAVTEVQSQQRIQSIGNQLLKANEISGPEFILIHSDEPNALCFPGGTIYITSGMLKVAPSDNDIATILAHELAHIQLGHPQVKFQHRNSQYKKEIFSGVMGASIGFMAGQVVANMACEKGVCSELGAAAAGAGLAIGLQSQKSIYLSNSQEEELQADKLSIELLRKANYHLSESLGFYNRLLDVDSDTSKTHPENHKRLSEFKSAIDAGSGHESSH